MDEDEIINQNTPADTGEPGAGTPPDVVETPPAGPSASEAFLDTLTDGDTDPTAPTDARARDEAGRFAPKSEQAPVVAPPAASVVPGAPPAAAAQPPADPKAAQAQEDAELLAGIKSERGRERVQKLIAERNETKERAETVSQSLQEVQQIVQSAGMDAQQFAEQIEFARLYNSGDPKNLRVAAQMIEGIRTDIYKKLGQDAPGVDVLSDFPDLAQKVNNFELDRQSALEIAQHRRHAQTQQQRQQATQQADQVNQQSVQEFQGAMQRVEGYLSTRAQEVDHQPRMEVLGKYFKDPANIQEFINTYQPAQMAQAIKWMYDNVQVAPRQATPSPLRARPSPLGQPSTSATADFMERGTALLDQMGI